MDDLTVEGEGEASLTEPDKAAEFVERTGVDALALAIGNAHGIYTQKLVLDFERLEAIRRATGVPLVLHGGSGTPSDQLHKAIDIGVSKVASELGRAFLNAIEQFDASKDHKGWWGHAIMEGKSAIKQVTARCMKELGSVGKVE